MGYRKYRRRREDDEIERFGWLVATVVFIVMFVAYFVYGFFAHCVFEWPVRLDVKVCWSEQVDPAKQKAAEKAANFIP